MFLVSVNYESEKVLYKEVKKEKDGKIGDTSQMPSEEIRWTEKQPIKIMYSNVDGTVSKKL